MIFFKLCKILIENARLGESLFHCWLCADSVELLLRSVNSLGFSAGALCPLSQFCADQLGQGLVTEMLSVVMVQQLEEQG